MSVTVALVVPAGDGIGASVDVSAFGSAKTFVVNAAVTPGETIVVEGSGDPGATPENQRTYNGVIVFNSDSPERQLVSNVANRYRVRRLNSGPGTPTITVSADPGVQDFAQLTVPLILAPSGGIATGAPTDISLFGDEVSLYFGGNFSQNPLEQLVIEGSQDNVAYDGIVAVNNGYPGTRFFRGTYNWLRVTRTGPPSNGNVLTAVVATSTSGAGGGFPGYGSPSQDNVILTDGVSLLVPRADHRHTPFPTADSYVVYAYDYDGVTAPQDLLGRPGYSLPLATPALTMAAALAAAVLTPFKTLEQGHKLLTHTGNGANLVMLIKPRAAFAAYRNIANTADQTGDFMSELIGWNSIVIRGSDLTNSASDKLKCGFGIAAGTNAAGYSAGAGTTAASLVNILTAAGAAPALPAEVTGFSALSGLRIRFSDTTPTVVLRGLTYGGTPIIKNGVDSIEPAIDLPAVPVFIAPGNAGNDTFFIETPGVVVGNLTHEMGGNLRASLAGITALTASVIQSVCSTGHAGLKFAANCIYTTSLAIANLRTYTDEVGATINCGMAALFTGTFSALNCNQVTHTAASYISVNQSAITAFVFTAQAFLARRGFSLVSMRPFVGTFGGTTHKGRITNSTVVAGVSGILSGELDGIDFGNCTQALIKSGPFAAGGGQGQGVIKLANLTSVDSGNTDVVLDMTLAIGQTVVIGAGITAAATLGHVRFKAGAGTALSPNCFSTVTSQEGQRDTNQNLVLDAGIGAVISPSVREFTNDAGVIIPEFRVVRRRAGGIIGAQADLAANCVGIAGVTINSTAIGGTSLVVSSGFKWIEFDAGPTLGALAYLSAVNDGFATNAAPAGPALTVELGFVVGVIGALGLVALVSSPVPVTSGSSAASYKYSGDLAGNFGYMSDTGRTGTTLGPNSYVPRACTISNLRVNVQANINPDATTIYILKNGVGTALSVSYAAGATGITSDLVNTVAFNGTTDIMDLVIDSAGETGGVTNISATHDVI